MDHDCPSCGKSLRKYLMMPEESVQEGALYRCPLCNTLILEPQVKTPIWVYILLLIFLAIIALVEVETIFGHILTKGGLLLLVIYSFKYVAPGRSSKWIKVDEENH